MPLRISAAALLAALALAAPASATPTGGAVAAPAARAFAVAPASVAPGATVTFAFRATPGLQARVDLLRAGAAPVRARLGRVPATGVVSLGWATTGLPAGRYTARLAVTSRGLTAYARAGLSLVVPVGATAQQVPPTTPGGVFPVEGAYTFGGADARFGAGRTGHVHQGQDVTAAAGTPVVSPLPGTVHWVAYQAAGAGYYVVVRATDGRDYVFMHFLEGSTAVAKGQAVAAGQRLGLVGATGDAQGPHLHFEIWPDGWWEDGSHPVDPLPQLKIWAGA